MAKKTTCPITRAQFRDGAQPVQIEINGKQMQVPVKFFSTGSLGWYLNTKTVLKVGDQEVPVQIGLNLTIVGSKELPQDGAGPAGAPAAAASAGADPGSGESGATAGGEESDGGEA